MTTSWTLGLTRSCVNKTQRKRVNNNDYFLPFAFQHGTAENAEIRVRTLGRRMNYYSFKLSVQEGWAEAPNLRFGQVYFNLLNELRPDLANEMRGTELDPFHLKFLRDVPEATEKFVMDRWDNSTEFPLDD
jgi:hypothetical protein